MAYERRKKILRVLYEQYLKGTAKEGLVFVKSVFFCYLTRTVAEQIAKFEPDFGERRVYITTIALKHCYDKRTAEEFDFFIG